jgi:hypothetical protein
MRRPVLAVVLALMSAACSGGGSLSGESTTTSTFPAVTPEPRICEAPVDTPIDVAGEPPWRQFADYLPWTDRDGCLVRVDVLAERPGPAVCGWENTRVIISGLPLGVPYTGTVDSVEFVRDPGGDYGVDEFVTGFLILDELPADAIDTNYRQADRALWLSPSDPAAVYLAGSGGVERWPLGEVPVCS